MESLYDISWKVSESDYRKGRGYSYSTLAKFDREGFDKLGSLHDKVDSPSLLFGSMVDTLLTDGKEEYDAKYEVASITAPEGVRSVVKLLYDTHHTTHRKLVDIPDNDILAALAVTNWNGHWLPATRIKSIKEKGAGYYGLLAIAQNKILVSDTDHNDTLECVNILRTNPITKWYFEQNNPFEPDIERFYQLKFTGEYEGIPLRMMADLIIVNHKTKQIIPCDLKTSFKPEWRFYKSYIEWMYYHQAKLYWYIIRQNLDKHPIYKDYELCNYRFIVISRNTKTPCVWTDTTTRSEVNHFYGKNKQIYCRNWREVLLELHEYMTNRHFTPIGIKENNNLQEWLNNE